MQRNALIAWLGETRHVLSDDDVTQLLELSSLLEETKPGEDRVEERLEFLNAATQILHSARVAASGPMKLAEAHELMEQARQKVSSLFPMLQANPEMRIAMTRKPLRDKHFFGDSRMDPALAEQAAVETAQELHRVLAAVTHHAMQDHGTTAWWLCWETRATMAAAASAFVASMSLLNMVEAQ